MKTHPNYGYPIVLMFILIALFSILKEMGKEGASACYKGEIEHCVYFK